jgi:hypothetical protein
VKALTKKGKGVPYQPLDGLALPGNARWEDPPGFKTGESILRVTTAKGAVWYTGDLLTNIQRTPGRPFSWLFSWTDSGPGFKLFKLGVWLMDVAALARAQLERL